LVLHLLTKNWLGVFIGNYAFHKFGFEYAGHKNLNDKSKNLFPIGILLGGEELHNNHHNMPYRPNYRHRWFEVDIGYVYAKIFEIFGLLKISKEKS
jgi:fatty-acid desaturase